MKALDYVARFEIEGRTIEALWRVIADMMNEIIDIGKARRISNDAGLYAILDEMDQKFASFFRRTKGRLSDGLMHPNVFRRMLKERTPEVFAGWNINRGGKIFTD